MRSGRRVATIGSALVVAGIAAYASYSHMRHLALAYGQDQAVATLLPISVDGLMVVATIALGDGRRHRWSAWLAFWAGVAASVIANVLAAQPSGVARTISAWPAIAFLLVVEVITRGGRVRSVAVTSAPSPVEVPATVADSPAVNPWVYSEPAADRQPVTVAAPKRTPARTPKRPAAAAKADTDTATKVARLADRLADIPKDKLAATIAAKLEISVRTARRHLAAMATDSEPDSAADTPPVNGHALVLTGGQS